MVYLVDCPEDGVSKSQPADMTIRDQNGNRVAQSVHRVRDASGLNGWAACVWSGGFFGPADWKLVTDVSWNVYRTRAAARDADIGDSNTSTDINYVPEMLSFGLRGWEPVEPRRS